MCTDIQVVYRCLYIYRGGVQEYTAGGVKVCTDIQVVYRSIQVVYRCVQICMRCTGVYRWCTGVYKSRSVEGCSCEQWEYLYVAL